MGAAALARLVGARGSSHSHGAHVGTCNVLLGGSTISFFFFGGGEDGAVPGAGPPPAAALGLWLLADPAGGWAPLGAFWNI